MTKKLDLNYFNLASLLYLIFPILSIWNTHHTGPYSVFIVVLCLFVVAYTALIVGYPSMSYRIKFGLLLIQYIGIIYFTYDIHPMTSLFLFYSAFAIPNVFHATMMSKEYVVFLLTMICCLCITFVYYPQIENLVAIFVFYVFINIIFIANLKNIEKRRYQQEIENKNAQINFLIAEQERNRIAQDLHDTLGHVFAAMSLKSELALKMVEINPERAKTEIQSLNTLSKEALNQIRMIIHDLKIPTFAEEVTSMETLLENANLAFHFEGVECAGALSPTQQALLAMVLREAINNVIKHARATKVDASLSQSTDGLHLDIRDNGQGILGEASIHLQSIQARVDVLNGELNIQNESGLHIHIFIPRRD